MSEDLSVAGPGSPVSLKKFLDQHGRELREWTVLVDGTGGGIAQNAPEVVYINIEDRKMQAEYYAEHHFDGKRVPAYLFRYLDYLFDGPAMDGREGGHWRHGCFASDREVAEAFEKGEITAKSKSYQYICNLIKYCKNNPEAAQCIGLIQLVGGALNMARKMNKGVRFYIDKPETALHPKRQSRIMCVLQKLREDYGFREDDKESTTKSEEDDG